MIDYSLADKLSFQYQNAKPYPYIVIDNFLPKSLMKSVLEEIKKNDVWAMNSTKWIEEFEQNKLYYPNHDNPPEEINRILPITKMVFDYLNSSEFLEFLQKLTGYKNLEKDPTFMGGGIHRIRTGGKLSVHLDYNEHPVSKKYRKLNLLIYLNENWKSEWKGNLELWSKDRKYKELDVEPIFNRAVLFNIEEAPHGHPIPLQTPNDVDRYSLALYYFSDVEPDHKHPVQFFGDGMLGEKNTETNEIKHNETTQNLDEIFKIN